MNKKHFNIDWEALKAIPCWTPLSSLEIEGVMPIADNLYCIGPEAYIFAHNDILRETKKRGPYMTILLWADSDGAAKRAMLMDIESDKGSTGLLPPPEMLYAKNCITYGELKNHLKKIGILTPYIQTAGYRIARDGAFVASSVSPNNWEFMYRNLKVKPSDTPFAIQFRLLDDKGDRN